MRRSTSNVRAHATAHGRIARSLVFASALVSACGAPPRTAPVPQRAPAARTLPTALAWVRESAEYGALTRQTYAAAATRLEALAPAMTNATWGVILDADETVLDNTTYEVRRAALDSAYTEVSWSAWVREVAAPAVPGAVAFTRRVHALGGRVVIVTNRADSVCAPTRANLQRVGVDADLVLCQLPGQPDKNPRFEAVQRGAASAALPALTVVEWVGDNIQDFPKLAQASRDDPLAMSLFGRRYFVLPNPIYGSWPSHPVP
jgi:5'-nucleotidase (lipoprotein e(P4) family)